jgi:hypothetical protein
VVSVVNNHLSSHWKEPENSASGKGREGENWSMNISLPSSIIFNVITHTYFYFYIKKTISLRAKSELGPKKKDAG